MIRWHGAVLFSSVVSTRLKRSFCFLLLLVISCTSPGSQPEGDPLSLWQIDHGESRVYLLGSVHALKPEHYPLSNTIEEAYEQSETTVFEIDLARLSSYEIALIMKELGSYTTPHSVETELSRETLVLLNEYIDKNKFQAGVFSKLKPWMISLQIALYEMKKSGYDAKLGIDQYFQTKAQEEDKPIVQLESFREQIELLAGDSKELQDISLQTTLLESETVSSIIGELVSAWQRGAADEMYALSTRDESRYPELKAQMEKLLDDRNVKMAEKIKGFLNEKGSYFVVVGALHMGGPRGLLKLLEDDFKVVQMYK